MARLSPRAVKNAERIAKSSLENSLLIEIEMVLARATSSQFEKSDKHIKAPHNYYMGVLFLCDKLIIL